MAQLEQQAWIRDPFQADITEVTLFAANEAQLADLSCNGNLEGKFSDSSLSILWLYAANAFHELSDIALSFLLPFSITYLCEARFAANQH